MLELPKGLACLSPKRKKKLEGLCMEERKDAALNVCVIGIKGLNHVHKIGLNKLSGIAAAWGQEITAHYSSGEEMVLLLRCTEYGDLVTDPVAAFSDLSDSRKREIARWLAENRMDAADIAYTIGQTVIARECGFGAERMDRLNRQWERDLREFYTAREENEPLLKKWLEEIGFIYENGKLEVYRSEGERAVRKRTAERWMEAVK